jgi:TolA-binding protein
MKMFFTISLLGGLIFSSIACSTSAPVFEASNHDSVEMYVWTPPDEHELSLRQTRQEMLDSVSREVEFISLINQGIDQQTRSFESKVQRVENNTESFERDFEAKIQFHKKQQAQLKHELAKINIDQRILKTSFATLKSMRTRPKPKIFSRNIYTAAMNLLKNGQYKRSMHKFNLALHSNPPRRLKDNIHFGLATVFYKLRKYSQAIKHLDAIRKHFPKGDKWHMSYVMLGMIHNQKGEKSRALFILNEALTKNPPEKIKNIIDLILNKIQGEPLNATS